MHKEKLNMSGNKALTVELYFIKLNVAVKSIYILLHN